MFGGGMIKTAGSLLNWGVLNGHPLDIDYETIYKGFNDTITGQSEGALVNLLIAGLLCWGLWSLLKLLFKRDDARKLEQWKKLETIKPDYAYKGTGDAQKRQWMRIEAEAAFSFWQIDNQGQIMDNEVSEKLLDLSAGGLSFYTDEVLDIDKKIHIQLDLGKPPIIKLTGRVARVQFSPEGEEKRYMIGIQFLGIRTGEQDRIIKQTLNSQRRVIGEQKRQQEMCPNCGQPLPYNERGEFDACPDCAANDNSTGAEEAAATKGTEE